jgi:hypothetical protein
MYFFGALIWGITYRVATENNTTEFSAVVASINPIIFYSIKVEGYNASFGLYTTGKIVDMDAIVDLKVGDEITFRIMNSEVNRMNSDDIIELVALRIGETDVITLETFNTYNKELHSQAIGGFAIAGSIFLSIAIIFFIVHKTSNRIKVSSP